MRIGVIGAGRIGIALTRAAVRSGHEVKIANSRDQHTLRRVAAGLCCSAGTPAKAAAFGEVVILAIPFCAVEQLGPVPFAGKVVLDTTNYYLERDRRVPVLDACEATTAEMVQC